MSDSGGEEESLPLVVIMDDSRISTLTHKKKVKKESKMFCSSIMYWPS